LRSVYNEYAPQWGQILNARDTAGRQGLANGLYDNLRTIVHDHDGRVEHKECWNRLVKLRNDVQVWKHNQQILPPEVSKLLDELRDLTIDFPNEADKSSREAGDTQPPVVAEPPRPQQPAASDGSTPIQVCGQDLSRICQTYTTSWETAKETHNLRNCAVVIDNMLAAVDASSAHHEAAASADPRFRKLVEFRAYCKNLSIGKTTDEQFIDTWEPVFFELMQIAHGFQLSR
jgi:hypothetical protein